MNGAAIAGGCGIATLADFTLAVPEAKFGYTEVKIGFYSRGRFRISAAADRRKAARDLLLTGRIIDATEAHRLGLVTEIVAAERCRRRAN